MHCGTAGPMQRHGQPCRMSLRRFWSHPGQGSHSCRPSAPDRRMSAHREPAGPSRRRSRSEHRQEHRQVSRVRCCESTEHRPARRRYLLRLDRLAHMGYRLAEQRSSNDPRLETSPTPLHTATRSASTALYMDSASAFERQPDHNEIMLPFRCGRFGSNKTPRACLT
jgi:hypothetical protein